MRRALMLALTALAIVLTTATPIKASTPGPFVTILFSRTEVQVAQACQPDAGQPTMMGDTEPLLQSLGLTATGTVNTLATSATNGCTHSDESLTASWSQIQQLAANGWSFTPHVYYGPQKIASLTPLQAWQATCGQVQTLQANGAGPGTGMISYPGVQGLSPAIISLQQNYGANCFAWGRSYSKTGTTPQSAAQTSPYWQQTMALKGGPGTGSKLYTDPNTVISAIQALQPGQWLTIQVYELVNGTSPAGDAITWSCDQPGISNTSNDVERYCFSDFATIVRFLASDASVTVTDPLTVGQAFGRPSSYGMRQP